MKRRLKSLRKDEELTREAVPQNGVEIKDVLADERTWGKQEQRKEVGNE